MPSFPELILYIQRNSIVVVLSVFVLIVLWTYWPSRKVLVENRSRIPLDEES